MILPNVVAHVVYPTDKVTSVKQDILPVRAAYESYCATLWKPVP